MSERTPETPGQAGLTAGSPASGEVARAEESGSEMPPPSAEETAALLKQLTVGTVIDGKYRIDAVIGKGAMGVVLAATHVHLKERVALKFLSTRAHGHGQGDDFHSRFRREAQVSAKLRNEHITRVIDVGTWRERVPFMVMDLLTGDDLRRTLKQAPGGRLPASVALDYVVQICEGLAEAHSHGIVHRDLKPSNLFITKRHDGTDLLKILDFGISKWSTQEEQLDELTQTGVVLGSPKYMAPEQLFGSATVDARADVWSIGAIFYEMLTGHPPYDFPTLTRICAELAADRPPPGLLQFVPDLPKQLESVVMLCFERDRERRVPNVAELAGALLDSVEAPFAGQVRQKIVSMLDPKGQAAPGSLATSSGGLPLSTGNYRSLSISSSSVSGATRSSSGALRIGADGVPASTAAGVEAMVSGEAPASGRRKAILAVAIVAALLGAGALFFALGGSHPDAAKGTPPAAVAAQPPPPATAPPPPLAAATPPSTASAEPAAPLPVAAAPPPAPAPPQRGGHGVGHRGGGGRPAPPAPTPPQATAAPAPAPAPTPAPAPSKPAANPLED